MFERVVSRGQVLAALNYFLVARSLDYRTQCARNRGYWRLWGERGEPLLCEGRPSSEAA